MEDATPKPKLTRTGTAMLDETPSNGTKLARKASNILSKYPSHLIKSSSIFSQNEDVKNESSKSNEWLDAFLTKDILFYIFTMLRRQDLSKASMVCKRWRTVAKDPYFGWIQIGTWILSASQSTPEMRAKLSKSGVEPAGLEFENSAFQGEVIHFLDENRQRVCMLYLSWSAIRDHFKQVYEAVQKYPKMYRASWESKHDSYSLRWNYCVELNVKQFEDAVKRKEEIPAKSYLEWEIQDENRPISMNRIQKVVENKGENIPKKNEIPPKQPDGLRDGLNLYKYQLDAVAWMKSVEDDIKNGVEFKECSLIPWRLARTEILLDPATKNFVTFPEIEKYTQSYTPKGGVLADDMGLGKTMEFLGLMLANPGDKEQAGSVVDKKIKCASTLVICPNHLTQQWVDEITKNSNPPLTALKCATITEFNKNSDHFAAVDLVVSSIQFIGNHGSNLFQFSWHRLILDEGHECINARNLDKLEADYYWYVTGTPFPGQYVVSSYSTNLNRHILQGVLRFLKFPYDHHRLYVHYNFALIAQLASDRFVSFESLLEKHKGVKILFLLIWKASVKDEYKVPEYVEELVVLEFSDVERAIYDHYDRTKDRSYAFPQNMRKMCSELPPSTAPVKTLDGIRQHEIQQATQAIQYARSSLANAEAQLRQYDANTSGQQMSYSRQYYVDQIQRCREDAKNNETTKSELERSLTYEARLAKVCEMLKIQPPAKKQPDDVVISNNNNNNSTATPDAEPVAKQPPAPASVPPGAKIPESLFMKMTVPQLKMELIKRGIRPNRSKIELRAQVKDLGIVSFEEKEEKPKTKKRGRAEAKEPAKKEAKTAKKAKPKKKKTKKSSKYYDSSSDSEEEQQSEEQEDEVVMDEAEQTPQYDLTKKKETVQLVEELLLLIEAYGTKMGNLIYYLRRLWEHTPESRIIIFSQFDTVLAQVSSILNMNDIRTVFLQGNVNVKNKIIASFKAKGSDVRVMMLSTHKAGSGTNLIEASHVILMDPVEGTKEQAQAIEAQAIARAHRQGQTAQVTLVRFIIQDTVEHTSYVKNYLNKDESQFHGKKKDMGPIHKAIAQVNKPQQSMQRTASEIRPRMVKASSIANMLANTPLRSSGSVIQLIEESTDIVLDAPTPSETNNNNNMQTTSNEN